MKKIILILSLLAAIPMATLHAQHQVSKEERKGQEAKSSKEVKAAVDAFIKAMVDGDVAKLKALTSPKVTYGHSGGLVQNQKEFLKTFESGATDFVKIDVSDETIDIFGNVAVVRQTLSCDTNDNNVPGHINMKLLTIWKKSKENWIIIARQTVKLPS